MKAVSIDQVSGQPREIQVAGKTFRMSQITVGILAQVETWARALPYKRLKEKLAELPDAPKEIKVGWYEQADKDSASKEFVQRELESINGVMLMIRKCFEVNHPDLSDEMFELIIGQVGLDVLQGFMEADNSLPIDEMEPAGGDSKKE